MNNENLIKSIVGECVRISKTKADAFFMYFPHIDCVEVRIMPDGWSEEGHTLYLHADGKLNGNYYDVDIKTTNVEALKRALATLRNFRRSIENGN